MAKTRSRPRVIDDPADAGTSAEKNSRERPERTPEETTELQETQETVDQGVSSNEELEDESVGDQDS